MTRSGWLQTLPPALFGGVVAIAVTLLARDILGTRLLAEIVVDAGTQVLQPEGFYKLIELLGSWGKPLLFVSVLLAELAIFALTWCVCSAIRSRSALLRLAIATALSWALFMGVSALLVAATEAYIAADQRLEYGLVAALACLAFAMLAEGATGAAQDAPIDSGRRALLTRIPAVALVIAAGAVIGRQVRSTVAGRSFYVVTTGQPTPEVTSNQDFYTISKNLNDPSVNGRSWRLRVGGISRHMLELSLDDVLAMPSHEQYTTLQCISNGVGGPLIGNALWAGFALRDLLQRVEPLPNATHVIFRAADDYTETLPLDFAMGEGVMLVHTMNGEPLPDSHGYPLRLLAPGKYGMKQPKWITEIALVDEEMLGYWEKRSWEPGGAMNTSTRIDVPAPDVTVDGPIRIHGIAFSGDRGIDKVEVSTDGGRSWNQAVLKPVLSPYTWVLWHYDWTELGANRRLTLQARSTDGRGELQSAIERFPHPSGATGYPKVDVRVKRV